MKKIDAAIAHLHHLSEGKSAKNRWHKIHPFPKLLITVFYVGLVLSFDRYDLFGLLGMVLYLIIFMMMGEISFFQGFRRLWLLWIMLLVIGAPNLFFDHSAGLTLGSVSISGGVLSVLTLILKGTFSLLAAYHLMIISSIEEICAALSWMRVPEILGVLVLLIYRYMMILLKEVKSLLQAYSLRAPKQKGLHFKVWGTFAGQLLLRSINRAQTVYESMAVRGFHPKQFFKVRKTLDWRSVLYLFFWLGILLCLRIFPVFKIVGNVLLEFME